MKSPRAVRAIGIIPARLASSRLPEKVIRPVAGKPLLQWVWEAAQKSTRLAEVWVATDDPRVAEIAEGFGAKTKMTSPHFQSGSDRVASVLSETDYEQVVCLQADEPLLRGEDIDRLLAVFERRPSAVAATLALSNSDPDALSDRNCVKVVCDASSKALYFSRAPLKSDAEGRFLQHLGIYAYRRDTLLQLAASPRSRLELAENLEQLRALEMGFEFWVELVDHPMVGVDTPSDLERAEKLLKALGGAEA